MIWRDVGSGLPSGEKEQTERGRNGMNHIPQGRRPVTPLIPGTASRSPTGLSTLVQLMLCLPSSIPACARLCGLASHLEETILNPVRSRVRPSCLPS